MGISGVTSRLIRVAVCLGLVSPVFLLARAAAGDVTAECQPPSLVWFDPIFFSYNAVLALFAVFSIPGITYFYVVSRKAEKIRRLRNDLSEERWSLNEEAIVNIVESQFRMRHYLGSMLTLTIVVLLGTSIILLLKPLSGTGCGGVDYSKGANFLLLGPYMLFGPDGRPDHDYYQHITVSLTAFQFGFLGAYVYLIGDLVRAYFILDLTPQVFVASTIRVITGSLLALVTSFMTGYISKEVNISLPLISFFFGYFPETALILIQKKVAGWIGLGETKYQAIPLSKLPGMSYAHETRLIREGYDNVENLATVRPLDLMLRTGFTYRQVRQWIAQAWLYSHLREDYEEFVKQTGITGADELVEFLDKGDVGSATPEECLSAATGDKYKHKIAALCRLVGKWKERADRRLSLSPQ
ncbi:MAG TPA: hypothetical protein VN494_11525 [Patescibacteria group bacterium]|nr:hypothetical protein [Patescibacteria group bacterium]